MAYADCRIASAHSIVGLLLPAFGSCGYLVNDSDMAVMMATRCVTNPMGGEIRVVHIPTAEVFVRKCVTRSIPLGHDW